MTWILLVSFGFLQPRHYSEFEQPSYKEFVRQADMIRKANYRYNTYCAKRIK